MAAILLNGTLGAMSAIERPERVARAVAAAPDPAALRRAYLELLKLSLCDLAGTATTSVWTHTDGSLLCRELHGDERRIRAVGADWPLHGVTMVGLPRLDDLQACVEAIVADDVEGDLVECGTWRGGASILHARHARRARRRRPRGLGGRLVPGLSGR